MFDNLSTSSLEVNNLEENSLEVDNTITSDELEAKLNYADGETNYAVFKRDKDNIIKVAAISLTTIFGGLSVFELISPKASITPPELNIVSNSLSYSFKLERKGIEDIRFTISNEYIEIYKLDLKEIKEYKGNISLEPSTYEITISSNSIFGNKEIYKRSIDL